MEKALSIIDLNEEFKHVVDFVKNHWKTNNDIEDILKMAWDKGVEKSKQFQCIKNETGLELPVMKMNFLENIVSKDKRSEAFLRHRPYTLHEYFSSFNTDREDSVEFDIGTEQEDILKYIKKNFKKYHENKPIGWAKFWRTYDGHCDHGENEDIYQKEFTGHEVVRFSNAYFFPQATTLPNLAYRHERNSTHPLFYLANVVFSHGFHSNIFNISYDIADSFRTIHNYFNKPEFHDKLVHDFDFSKIISNQFILDLEKSLPPAITEEVIAKRNEEKIKAKKEFDTLSPEEQEEKIRKDKEELRKSLSETFDSIFNKLKR